MGYRDVEPRRTVALRAVVDLEHEQLRDIGFEFRDGVDAWGFYRYLPDDRWDARVARYMAETEGMSE